jgi:hypothetical protein
LLYPCCKTLLLYPVYISFFRTYLCSLPCAFFLFGILFTICLSGTTSITASNAHVCWGSSFESPPFLRRQLLILSILLVSTLNVTFGALVARWLSVNECDINGYGRCCQIPLRCLCENSSLFQP